MNSKYNNGRRKFIKESLSIFGGIVIIPRHVLGRGFVSPSDKINLGFIGTGVQGRYLMKEFNKINEVKLEYKKISGLIGFNAAKGRWIEIYLFKKL